MKNFLLVFYFFAGIYTINYLAAFVHLGYLALLIPFIVIFYFLLNKKYGK